jgi:PAS domain S-box-containing protein
VVVTMTDRTDPSMSWMGLIAASERMAGARSLEGIVDILRQTARAAVGADGIAVIIRDGDKCFYAVEDAVGPLWAGSRFPMSNCISGWAMVHGATAAIPDIAQDPRIPFELYRDTFVRSLVMVPIGAPEPIAALGAYWSDIRDHDAETVAKVEALARSAAVAIENARLIASLRESERQRAVAVAAGRMGVWRFDVDSGVLETSESCRRNFGRDPGESFSYEELRAAIHPADRERVTQAIETSLATGGDYDIEYRILTPAGELRWISIRAQPERDPDGTPRSLAGVSIDVTDRKALEENLRDLAGTFEARVVERTQELMEAQEALRQSQKLEAMGQLTGGVAHDFNNLLVPILGSLDLLSRRGLGDAREQRLIAGALQSAERARTLVQRLLAFARRQPLTPTAIDLAALLLELGPLIGTTIGPRIELGFDIAEGLPLARGEQNQIEMALINLVVNARDAMPDGGRLRIEARSEMVTGDHPAGLIAGEYVRISIADTGAGMDEATLARAIEPFFSTKGIGRGTGLGLSMVHGLVSQLGGALQIESREGLGTAIHFWLPATAEPLIVTPIAAEPQKPRGGVVLVVDDEPLVRASTADMLTELGFRVREAASGAEALAILAARGEVDLLVTDHLMPQMTGTELVAAARKRWPGMRALIVSGYSDSIGILPDLPRLEKPFRQADLAASVAQLLGVAQAAA